MSSVLDRASRLLVGVLSTTVAAVLLLLLLPVRPTAAQVPDCAGVSPSSGAILRAHLVTADLESPVVATSPPGDRERLFLVEQRGAIRILRLEGDALEAKPFLDIRAIVNYGGEKGLLGLAFHPDYASNGWFFVNYTRTIPGTTSIETVVARYAASASDPDEADRDSAKTILKFPQPQSNHNGGQLLFGPVDGYLHVFTGDGGGGGDPQGNGQKTTTFLGKILRIDVDSGDPYAVPTTNPFVDLQGVLPEIWALGLRNPWRCAFDPETGDIYVADVGQGAWEEVNWRSGAVVGGENYGWNIREGAHPYSDGTLGPGTLVDPILEYPHSGGAYDGCSVTGGVVYRGCAMPDLAGTYFFADYCASWVRTFRVEAGEVVDLRDRTAELNADLGGSGLDSISSFGTDGSGEAYILSLSGRLHRIVPGPSAEPSFLRSDANGDGAIDISDPVHTLLLLFEGVAPTVGCADALDANDDGESDVSDAIHTLRYLFVGGTTPPPPFPTCGPDPTPDALACDASPCTP